MQIGAAVDARHPRQQIVDLGLRRRRDRRARLALGAGRDDAALLQHVFAHGQADAGLLLVADQRQMRVEQVMRGVALAGLGQLDDIDQQFREGIAGHGAVGAALHLEIEEQAAIADQDRQRPQRAVLLEAAQRRDLLQARPVLVLEHHAGRPVHHDLADHGGREQDRRASADSPAAPRECRRRSLPAACLK